jgi:hypothetical protein
MILLRNSGSVLVHSWQKSAQEFWMLQLYIILLTLIFKKNLLAPLSSRSVFLQTFLALCMSLVDRLAQKIIM